MSSLSSILQYLALMHFKFKLYYELIADDRHIVKSNYHINMMMMHHLKQNQDVRDAQATGVQLLKNTFQHLSSELDRVMIFVQEMKQHNNRLLCLSEAIEFPEKDTRPFVTK